MTRLKKPQTSCIPAGYLVPLNPDEFQPVFVMSPDSAQLWPYQDGFCAVSMVCAKDVHSYRLTTFRGEVRKFRTIDTAVTYLRHLGARLISVVPQDDQLDLF